jgi:NAD(P)-dependent dehydrogenase (short-subunit alcohol dehydrogenase family)
MYASGKGWANSISQTPDTHHTRIKVFVADRDLPGAEAVAAELNKNQKTQIAWAVRINVADWESQREGFEAAVKQFGRIDYVYPIAGIGEVSWLPNRPGATEFTKPDLSVIDVDGTGVLYTASLAIQQFRRQEVNEYGFRGKSKCRTIKRID